ncbi:hypothetical protein AnigIFM60653_004625 [Aspergillus niger]|nr:hypothetical protein AnigIFM60653_004625 [Aspergillus niger]
MRFLCLHGIGSNAEVFKTQLSAIQAALGSQHDFVFVEGDIPSEAGPGRLTSPHSTNEAHLCTGVYGVAEGPYFSFFNLPIASQIYDAFELIDQALEYDGPFDGIMGFSQGASVAASYLLRNQGAHLPFKCAVFFCATAPFNVESTPFRLMDDGTFRDEVTGEDISAEIAANIPDLLDRKRFPSYGKCMIRPYPADGSIEIALPTVHVYGRNDGYYPQSRSLAEMCQSFDREELEHKRGHSIPLEQGMTSRIVDLIRRLIHAVELHMGSPQDIEQALLGSWSLLDYRSQLQDGSETFLMGKGARGIINFNPNGRMSVQLQPAVTKKVKETVHDLLAYTGRYWVETQPDGSVMLKHHLEVCSWPEGDGSYQLRTVELSEDQLVLSSPAPLNVEVNPLVTYDFGWS